MVRLVNKLKEALNKPKQINEILDEQIETGLREHKRSNQDLFLSAISAGLEVGFSVFLMASIYSLFNDVVHPSMLHVMLAIAYPLGFIFVVIGKSELFTEHTSLAVIPVLSKDATIKSLLILWGVVYLGNLLGGYIFGYILSVLPERLNAINNGAFYGLAKKLIHHPWHIILGSGILAGWLMGLLSWLVTSSQDTLSRIVIITLITSVIGIGGLHHSIVGSIEVFTASLTSIEITWKDYLHVQTSATLGNIIGGVVFVAFVKFSHVNPRNKHYMSSDKKNK
ncbi:formate/nitrite transporter family protein [Carboxylicivirga sp. A043]|uniref:formate/nitrite transporter family protein n=1 Tax=Carboxylicivirga litoralis TaxID=2816963 RepID=UPI0021CB83C4|nr:formate/nitrite transporter family protein [Carboxylicivirga sp. A043]MCU4158280.1 formate/nitrite transporter family protein [Carboxylicivirga sp. A043]